MVSTELLRRFHFFSFLNHAQLQELAMICEEVSLDAEVALFEEGETADALYLLIEGDIDLHHQVIDEHLPDLRKDFLVGHINPGEVLGLSSMIEPFLLRATAKASEESRLLKIDAGELRQLTYQDPKMGAGLQSQLAKATMERLQVTRVLLAAATQPV